MAIDVEQLRREFVVGRGRSRKVIPAVDSISFHVDPGERIAYIGPNGAGKSTSIKMLTGILHPTSGSAQVLGMVPWRDRRELTRRIGTLFGQRSQLWAELTPRQSFRMLGAIFDLPADRLATRTAELGELLDATELFDAPVRGLSLGQRMRCELAACLLHEPEILFLDEPTIGLDLLGKSALRELLVRLNEQHRTTIFLTSHDVADIEHVAERVIVINHGSVIYDDEVATVRRTLLATKLVEVTLDRPTDLPEMDGVVQTTRTDTTLKLTVDTQRRAIREVIDAVLEALPVIDLSVTDPPLEHVIAEIYSAPRR
ncbi:MAG: viologen exporter family transport system ATP-binding protein [Actinomycetota bacterium]|jgi:ABC-2 type transport system ATP-binding protein|nr:viologen exporter family transport system ATP-binding protein [Actinomycetota bacterium]